MRHPTDSEPVSTQGELLLRVAPNPLGPTTMIRIESATPWGDLEVHDMRGRVVRVLARGPFAAGDREWSWDGRDHRGMETAAGVYIISVRGDRRRVTQRVVRTH